MPVFKIEIIDVFFLLPFSGRELVTVNEFILLARRKSWLLSIARINLSTDAIVIATAPELMNGGCDCS